MQATRRCIPAPRGFAEPSIGEGGGSPSLTLSFGAFRVQEALKTPKPSLSLTLSFGGFRVEEAPKTPKPSLSLTLRFRAFRVKEAPKTPKPSTCTLRSVRGGGGFAVGVRGA